MSLQFPSAPTVGEVYDRYTWTGEVWDLTPGSGGGGGGGSDGFTFTQDTEPTATGNGQTWFNTATGDAFVWIVDATSSQWVQFAPGSGGGGEVAPLARLATSWGGLSFTTTSTVAQRVPELALAFTPTRIGQRLLIEANLFVGANVNADDTFFTIIERNSLTQIEASVGASGVNTMASHRWQINTGGLEIANIKVAGILVTTGLTELIFEPAMWVRVASPVQQLFLNRRGADTVLGMVSSISITELSA